MTKTEVLALILRNAPGGGGHGWEINADLRAFYPEIFAYACGLMWQKNWKSVFHNGINRDMFPVGQTN
jgi:hypothetical protein